MLALLTVKVTGASVLVTVEPLLLRGGDPTVPASSIPGRRCRWWSPMRPRARGQRQRRGGDGEVIGLRGGASARMVALDEPVPVETVTVEVPAASAMEAALTENVVVGDGDGLPRADGGAVAAGVDQDRLAGLVDPVLDGGDDGGHR